MKRLIATAATLFVVFAASDADAGVMYGNGVADRLSTGTNPFARFYRYLGKLEYRKDVWLFGRPVGDPPTQFCPECGEPMHSHGHGYYYQSYVPQATMSTPTPAQPAQQNPTLQPTPSSVPTAPPTVQAAPPAQ